MSQEGMPFVPLAAVAPGLTLAHSKLASATLPRHAPHRDPGVTCRWAREQHLGAGRGAGGTGAVGTHSGDAGFLIVAHAPVHGSHNEDVFRLGLTVKQGGGGDFACGAEAWGGPGREQGRKESVSVICMIRQQVCLCVSPCVCTCWGCEMAPCRGEGGAPMSPETGMPEVAA